MGRGLVGGVEIIWEQNELDLMNCCGVEAERGIKNIPKGFGLSTVEFRAMF